MKQLKAFNQTVSVTVDVDTIYHNLIDTFPKDYKHKELLAHTIIGTSLEKDTLGFIYSALNGYDQNVNFEVDDMIICKEEGKRGYYELPVTEEGKKPKIDWKWVEIGECKVIDINVYRGDKLHVEFNFTNSEGKKEKTTRWVDHRRCTKLAPEPVAVVH